MLLKDKYTYSVEKKRGKKLNPHLIITIYQTNEKGEKNKIGQYERDHHDFFLTFYPFKQGVREFALISKHYSKTSVIELPSCKVIAEESWALKDAFCPMDFYVSEQNPYLGFVAGCRFNDDTSYKIECLDLNNLQKGKIIRDNRFGYIELSENIKLADAINQTMHNDKDYSIDVAVNMTFTQDGKLINREILANLLKNNGFIVFEKKRVLKEE